MDWNKYTNIYDYVKQLPCESSNDFIFEDSFEQSIVYPSIKNPIQTIDKKIIPLKTIRTESSYTLTVPIWNQVVSYLDETYSLSNPSLQYSNTHFFIQALKNYIMDPIIFKFLSGRRAYPILELLDQPRISIQKKNVQALGYFLSFLFDQIIYINDQPYMWKVDLMDSIVKINIKGYSH